MNRTRKRPRNERWGLHAIALSVCVVLTGLLVLATFALDSSHARRAEAYHATWTEQPDKVVQVNIGSDYAVALTSRGVKLEGNIGAYFVGSAVTVYCNPQGSCTDARPYDDPVYVYVVAALAAFAFIAAGAVARDLIVNVVMPRHRERRKRSRKSLAPAR